MNPKVSISKSQDKSSTRIGKSVSREIKKAEQSFDMILQLLRSKVA